MQSSFTVHDMESTSEPTSPMAAAASDKRKFRTCSNCTSCMPSIDFDAHTLCIGCRHQVCDLTVYCDECRNWSDTYRSAFVKYNRSLNSFTTARRELASNGHPTQTTARRELASSVHFFFF